MEDDDYNFDQKDITAPPASDDDENQSRRSGSLYFRIIMI
jgi:hypothetical protein